MGSIIWAEPWFILYSEQERGWYGWKKWRKYKGDNSANYKVVFLGNRGNCLYKLNLMLWLARRNTAIYAFGVLVLFKWSLSFDHIIWDIVSSDQILEWTNKNIINEWIDYPITTSFFLFFFLPHIEKILSKNQTAVIEFIFTGFFFFHLQEDELLFLSLAPNLPVHHHWDPYGLLFHQTGFPPPHSYVFPHQCPVLPGDLVYYNHHPQDTLQSSQWAEDHFFDCLLNMYLFYSLVISELYKLTTMATDRYLAICNPFYYPTIKTSQPYTQLTVGCFFCGFFMSLPEIAWISTLLFCGPNQIQNIFCNFDLILNLTCMNTDRLF